MTAPTFAHPAGLTIALALACALAIAYRHASLCGERAALVYSNLAFLTAAARTGKRARSVWLAMWVVALALVALAAGDPRVRVATSARATAVICIDTSGSMLARDVLPTRAAAAKAAAAAFIDAAAPGTRVGLVAFAEKASVIQIPTADRNRLASALNALPKPDGGTAIGDALNAAARVLPNAGRRSVVLITDGENNRGEAPEAAARTLAAMHVSIATVAVGASPLTQRALRRYAGRGDGAYLAVGGASNLRAALSRLGQAASTQQRPVDLTALVAISGGALMALATLAGSAAGRYP